MENKIIRKPLKKLKQHPLQSKIYPPCSAAQDKAFAADVRERGQREPIHVLPPGNKAGLAAYTVIDGHRRWSALEANGEKEASVLIREDLKDADLEAVNMEYVKFNLVRRQLHPLDQARALGQLFAQMRGKELAKLEWRETDELRAQLCDLLGMGKRNVDRYLHVLKTPIEIQTAVRDGTLRLVLGSRVAFLTAEEQQEVVRRISAADPKKVNGIVLEMLAASPQTQNSTEPPVRLVGRITAILQSLQLHAEHGDFEAAPFVAGLRENLGLLQEILRTCKRRRLQ